MARTILCRRWRSTKPLAPWTDTLLVVELGPAPASVRYRAYAEALDGTSVLAWTIHRLQGAMDRVSPRCAVLASATETLYVRLALRDRDDVLVQPTSPRAGANDLRELALRTGSRRLLFIGLTAGFLPRVVWADLWREHTTARRHATLLHGTPCAAPPLLVEFDWLRAMALSNRTRCRDPREFVQTWLTTKHARAARWAMRVGAVRPFQARTPTSRSRPYQVSLKLPSDVDDLRAAVREIGEGSRARDDEWELLGAWARARARRAVQTYASPRARSCAEQSSGGRSDGPVLYAQVPSAFAGCEQVVVTLAEQVAQRHRPRGCCALVALPGTFSDRLQQAGVPVDIANRELAAPTRAGFAYCRRVLQRLDPALVHGHAFIGVPLAFGLEERGVPLVQHVHVADERSLRALEDQVLTASSVIVVSQFVRERVLRLGVDPARVHVVYNGIDLPHVSDERRLSVRRSVRQELGLSDRAGLILLPARFAPNKRQAVAVQATAVLAARSPDAHLLLVGEAHRPHQSLPDVLRREAGRKGVSHRVHFLGFHEDMDRLYAAADVLLLPSEDDPIPLVVLEAMAVGVPVVASRSGGIPEMVEHGKSGLLVEPGDVNGFADALRQVLSERELRDHLTRGGRERVETHFSLRRFVDEVLAVYDEVLGSCGDG